MRRPLSVLCAAALGLAGLGGLSAPATAAAPAPQAARTAAAAVPDELLVGYVAGATPADRERARGRASAQRQDQVVAPATGRGEVELVRLPAGKDRDRAVAELQADRAVAYAEPNWLYTTQASATDPFFVSTDPAQDLWGMYGPTTTPSNGFGSGAAAAWATATGTVGTYVGVIDEGIQFDHPDLAGQVWRNPFDPVDGIDNDGNGYVDDVRGWDFDANDNTVYDGGTRGSSDDHGTHVSGTIGAKANNGAGVVGVNWNVTLISGKFLGRRGGSLDAAVRAVDYFTDLKTRHGLNIVATNNSWGGGGESTALLDAITRAAKADILFVAAAGNSGTDNDATPSYPSSYDTTRAKAPAAYDAVISVAAIDRLGAKAGFSQYGATSVDLGAPGVGVWSTTAPGTYESYNGTSMATPHVTGAAALYASATGARGKTVRDALLGTAVATSSLCGLTVTGGRLDVAAALAGTPRTTACTTGGGASTTGGSVVVTKGAKSGAFTSVTASWKGFTGREVTVTRSSGDLVQPNPGQLTESWRGTGTVTYTVCETDKTGCRSASVVL